MRLLGNLYIEKACLDTLNGKDEGWVDYYSKIRFYRDKKNPERLDHAVIKLNEEESLYILFHELEHYYIVKALLSIGIGLHSYLKTTIEFNHKMMSDYDPSVWPKKITK